MIATEHRQDAPEAPLVPDHELLRRIGSGAYGEVWLARNAVGTLRAVKIVLRDQHATAESFEREFKGLQEFEPVSRTHEGLVDILTLGLLPEGAGFYYVMELADDVDVGQESRLLVPRASLLADQNAKLEASPPAGKTPALRYTPRTLRADLKSRGALPADEVVALGLKLTAALAHLHQHGLVHRDVKPSNILFIGGEPKLADAGLVAAVDDARSLVGTAGYIAPEGPGTPQADLYALGKVLYEAAFGKDRQEFPALPADVASRPDHARLLELNAVLLKACDSDRRERYNSADQMRADLELLHAGRSVKRQQAWQETRRLTARLGSAAAVVVAAWFLFNRFSDSNLQQSNVATPTASIFILPFLNDGTNQVDELLRNRITDALRDGLAGIGLQVGETKFGWVRRNETELRRDIKQRFPSFYTLAGRIRVTTNEVLIAAALHDRGDGGPLWEEVFDGSPTQLHALEQQVIKRVAKAMVIEVAPKEWTRIEQKLTANLEAYQLYEKAKQPFPGRVRDRITRDIGLLTKAIAADPNFLDAYAALGDTLSGISDSERPPGEVMPQIRELAAKMVAVDDSYPRGHSLLGWVELVFDWNLAEAEREFLSAQELEPDGLFPGYLTLLRTQGRLAEARAYVERARQLDPTGFLARDCMVTQLRLERRYDEAIALTKDTARLYPNSYWVHTWLGWLYCLKGDYETALKEFEQTHVVEKAPWTLAALGVASARAGRSQEAREILNKLSELGEHNYVSGYWPALVHAALGEGDAAMDCLERAFDSRSEQLVNSARGLRTQPIFENLFDHPRFVALEKKIGLR
jgi:serine/threonine protein kinase